MNRILGLSSIPLDDKSAGAERIGQLYRHLPEEFQTTLVTLGGVRGGGGWKKEGALQVVRIPSPAQTLFYYVQRARLSPFFQVARFHRRFALGAAPYLSAPFDLVQFDSLWLTPWAAKLPRKTPVVYGSHNFETDWYEGEIRRYPFRSFHARTLSRLEREAVLRADRVLATTEEDREKFVRSFGVPEERVRVVPNGYDASRFRPVSDEERMRVRRALGLPEEGRIALFAGSRVGPNEEAVESIVRSVAPKGPEDLLYVVAGSVGERYGKGRKGKVHFTGPVPDILPYFQAADIGLNPIRLGSGSNIKLLQYLGAGLAVLSTDFGMRGFDDLRAHVTVARIDRFHYYLDRVMPDPAAVHAVQSRHSWVSASAQLARVYHDLLGADSKSPPERSSESFPEGSP